MTQGVRFDAHDMRRLGLGHVPEDRTREGLIGAFEANECTILGYHREPEYNAGILTNRGAVLGESLRQMNGYDVRPAEPRRLASAFSGGNQQKIVVAREMERGPILLLVGQPTRGVDIGAIEFIHRQLVAMRDRGTAILLVSVELDEILSLSDRILVMFDGMIVGEVASQEADERSIGLMMAGVAAESRTAPAS